MGYLLDIPMIMTQYIERVEMNLLTDLNLKFTKYIAN